MKNRFFASAIMIVLSMSYSLCNAQTVEIETLKSQKEVYKFHVELAEEKISLKKEELNYEKLQNEAATLKSELLKYEENNANNETKASLLQDKNYLKLQKKSLLADKNVSRSFDKRTDYEAKIKKIENKLEAAKYFVEIKEK